VRTAPAVSPGLGATPLPSLLNTDWANSWIENGAASGDRIKTLTETVPSAEAAKAPTHAPSESI